MVALNWQKYGTIVHLHENLLLDLGMQIHEALFQANYQHGYVLKPAALLPASHPPACHHPTPYESKPCRIKLDVQVISGQQLPRPKDYKPGHAVDPYVQIEMICPNGQTFESRTRAVRDNEFNPMWDEKLSFDAITPSREFVFIRYPPPLSSSLTVDFHCITMKNPLQATFSHPIASAYKISTKVPISFPAPI
jgi:hypothetical protein